MPNLVLLAETTLKRIAIFGSLAVLVLVASAFVAWATSPDPKYNPATFEDTPLVESVAQYEDAITLAQYAEDDGVVRTILVLAFEGEAVTGVDLRELGGINGGDPFDALASVKALPATAEQAGAYPTIVLPMDRLLSAGSVGSRHIGTGTNFPNTPRKQTAPRFSVFPSLAKPLRPERPSGSNPAFCSTTRSSYACGLIVRSLRSRILMQP